MGNDSGGSMIFEDLQKAYKCNENVFNQLFTGETIIFSTPDSDSKIIDGSNVTDTSMHDSSGLKLTHTGKSHYQGIIEDWNNYRNHPWIVGRAEEAKKVWNPGWSTEKIRDKRSHWIYDYMHKNMPTRFWWHNHINTKLTKLSQVSLEIVLNRPDSW